MATERMREFRDWLNLGLTAVTVLIIPTGLLVLRNQRLEIREEMRTNYVSLEAFRIDHNSLVAENTKLAADITEVKAKLDKIQITLVRLTDAAKLKDP